MPDVIVSLTTWKGRIFHPNFPKNLVSLIRQETRFAHRVVLVLSREEFGYEFELPSQVQLLVDKCPNFEVLWTYWNTKALKNYNPTQQKYPDLPIIVVGDDTIYCPDLVETVMTDYLNSDRKTVLAAMVARYGDLAVPWRIRLFPPNCMADFDEGLFMKYFNGHNDLFYAARLLAKGTRVEKMDWDGLWYRATAFAQNVRMLDYRKVPEYKVFTDFMQKFPALFPTQFICSPGLPKAMSTQSVAGPV